MSNTYFVTGALGHRRLGRQAPRRPRRHADRVRRRRTRVASAILDGDAFDRVQFVTGDITDKDAVARAVDGVASRDRAPRRAAGAVLQADPALGTQVNVVGTLCFEAALACGARMVYASSAAVFGPPEPGEAAPDEQAACAPTTHYGVYKRANEGTAQIYWQDNGVPSVGLRPLTVYGVGRDQGMTSGPTSAMKAAVLGRPYTIGFRGVTDVNYVADTAAAFVRCADDAPRSGDGAKVYNLHGDAVQVADIVETIERLHPAAKGSLGVGGPVAIPAARRQRHPPGLPRAPDTSLEDGVGETLRRFAALRQAGELDACPRPEPPPRDACHRRRERVRWRSPSGAPRETRRLLNLFFPATRPGASRRRRRARPDPRGLRPARARS